MSGWTFRREERDGRLVSVPVYDGGRDEAEATERRLALDKMRGGCPNRVNGFCSPSKPSCPCYRCGKCVAIKA